VLTRHMDRAAALSLVDDWCETAVRDQRSLQDVAIAVRPSLAGQLDEAFSLEAVVADLACVLDEELAGLDTTDT